MPKNYRQLAIEITKLRYDGKLKKALQEIEKYLKKQIIDDKERINVFLLRASILKSMGVYQDLIHIINELIDNYSWSDKPVEFLKANILKIISLQRLSIRNESLKLITEMEDFLQQHNEIPVVEQLKIKADLLYQKGNIFWHKGKVNTALKYLYKSMKTIEKTEDKEFFGKIYNRIGTVYLLKGMLDECLTYLKKNLNIQVKLMNKQELSTAYNNIGEVYSLKGEYEVALECYKNSLNLDQELGNKTDIGISILNIGTTHFFLGNYQKALKALKKSLKLNKEVNNDYGMSYSLHYLIDLSLETDAPKEEINCYMEELKALHHKSESEVVHEMFLLSKGLILKSGSRLSEKMEAQSYFRNIIGKESPLFDISTKAFLNLIEILLLELKSTEEKEVLDEINNLTNVLLNIATKQNLAPLLVEVLILQSILSLVQLEIDEAKILLDKAGKLADEKNLRKLSLTVMKEQKELDERLNSWKNLIDKKASFTERVELAQIEDKLIKMINHKLEIIDDMDVLFKEFKIEKLSLIVFRYDEKDTGVFKTIDLPKEEIFENKLPMMSATFMSVLGQGEQYHSGLFGPLPAPIQGYSAIIYSQFINDREQADNRMKGRTYTLFCFLYPQRFSSLFYNRSAIINIFKEKITVNTNLNDLTERFLRNLKEEVFSKITDLFSPIKTIITLNEASNKTNTQLDLLKYT